MLNFSRSLFRLDKAPSLESAQSTAVMKRLCCGMYETYVWRRVVFSSQVLVGLIESWFLFYLHCKTIDAWILGHKQENGWSSKYFGAWVSVSVDFSMYGTIASLKCYISEKHVCHDFWDPTSTHCTLSDMLTNLSRWELNGQLCLLSIQHLLYDCSQTVDWCWCASWSTLVQRYNCWWSLHVSTFIWPLQVDGCNQVMLELENQSCTVKYTVVVVW